MVDPWEKHFVIVGMRRLGGSFVMHLGHALQVADAENTAKIKATWPEYWANYLAKGKEIYNKENG